MSDRKFDCESLRPVAYINEPDPRTAYFGKKLADYHNDVSSINLNDNVPREIATQFETTKNLYLYGWFIWRFYTVSEHHALACLEFALRSRYEKTIPKKKYFPKGKVPGLKALLQFAIDKKDIKNEGFSTWQEITWKKARSRYKDNKYREMHENGLDQINLNYGDVEISEEDKDWSYVQILSETLPYLRNDHAHGSSALDMFHGPLHTIRIVSEIINQIFSNEPPP